MSSIYIRTTEVGTCQRPRYYRNRGYKALPSHFYSVKGRISHSLMEHELSGSVGDLTPIVEQTLVESQVPEHGKDELRAMASDLHDRFHSWKQHTKLIGEGEPISVEERLYREVVPGVMLSGQSDLKTDTTLIDFKSGSRTNRKSYRQQLGCYRWLNYDKQDRLVNVFLGEPEPEKMELVHDLDSVQKDMKDYWLEVNKTIEEVLLVEKDILPPARRSFICGFCEYNDACRGFGGRDE